MDIAEEPVLPFESHVRQSVGVYFEKYSSSNDDTEIWNNSSLSTYLCHRFPSIFPALDTTITTLFRFQLYLGNYPFGHIQPNTLSVDGLLRSLVWLCTDETGRLLRHAGRVIRSTGGIRDEIIVRSRTNADKRRVIFQAFACHTETLAISAENAQKFAAKAFDGPISALLSWTTPYDEDGDELYHDILDMFTATQPLHYVFIPHTRNRLRHIAKRYTNKGHFLADMVISGKDLIAMLKLNLSVYLNYVEGNDPEFFLKHDAELTEVAGRIITRCNLKPGEGMSYYVYESILMRVAPNAFTEVVRLFESLKSNESNPPRNHLHVLPVPEGSILTPAIAGQLKLFLPFWVLISHLSRYVWYNPMDPNKEIPYEDVQSDILSKLCDHSRSRLFLLSGLTSPPARTEALFGIYSMRGQSGILFQLLPIHDVFWPLVQNSRDKIEVIDGESEEIWIGDHTNGVSIGLCENMKHCTIIHRVDCQEPSTEQDYTPYKDSRDRGNWVMGIEVDRIELWLDN